jgi:nicotinamide-nucleotide amidase
MKANILSIGDELLIGQTLNTNAHWLATELTQIGISVLHMVTLSDEANDIISSVEKSMEEADITLITGGLGPTNDDITLNALCQLFESELILDEQILQALQGYYNARGRILTDDVKAMAYVPSNATTLYNKMGTAPGTLFQKNGRVVISMPGVPYEMKGMMENDVFPWIKQNLKLPVIVHETILTAGQGESQIALRIKQIEDQLPAKVKLAYLPSIGTVKLRLTAKGEDELELRGLIEIEKQKILKEIGNYVYGFNLDKLEASIGRTLTDLGITISTAESCTGGSIAKMITAVSGSSVYFKGSIVAYSNEVKMNLLHVLLETLEQYGAVSEPVVEQMIKGAIAQLKTDIAIAVSGVAGPTGGTEEKPVGTVFVGVGTATEQYIRRFQFTSDREKNIEITTVVALVMLRKFLATQFVESYKKK